MIEIRYRVVNKWLKEIRDIDVQDSVKGNSGSFGVTTPLHCKAGQYLDTNLTFHHNSFQTSLNSGLLRTYLQNGDIVQVWYDTDLKKEVSGPYGQAQPTEKPVEDDQVTAIAKIFKEAGITADDLKDIVSAFKAKKQGIVEQPKEVVEEPKTVAKPKKARKTQAKTAEQPVDNSKIVVDNSVDNSQQENQKNIENPIETKKIEKSVDKPTSVVDNLKKEQFKSLGYQSKLKFIRECNNTAFLQWILSNFTQTAIFNAVNKRLAELQQQEIQTNTTPKEEIK